MRRESQLKAHTHKRIIKYMWRMMNIEFNTQFSGYNNIIKNKF